jgi:HEPN domain
VRPEPLDDLIRDATHQVSGSPREHRTEAMRNLSSARQFRKTAQLGREQGLPLPVISNLHEAARLAVTAVAAKHGLRFSNRAGAHMAVVDYAFGFGLATRTQWAQLDELRDLRHKTNYPSDVVEPSEEELDQFGQLVDDLLNKCQMVIAPIPPPPKRA